MTPELTTRHLRRRNRAAVLKALVRDGETTRGQLAPLLHLSPATVANIVTDLVTEGLIHETGSLPSEVGRPVTLLSVRPDGAHFIGADVGEDGVTVEVFDLALAPRSAVFREVSSRAIDAAGVSAALASAIDEAIIAAGSPNNIYGIGLGLPGIVEAPRELPVGAARRTITLFAQSLNWPPTSLESIYGRDDIPVFADNGAKTLATAESWFGAVRDIANGVVALFGRGVGLGVINDGRILRGTASSASEWGHTKISIGGPVCNCGNRGCLEAYVGGGAIARRWREAGAEPSADAETALRELVAAAAHGDTVAKRVLDETIEIMGIGLGNLVNMFNPERIVLGGWAGLSLAQDHLADVASATRSAALVRPGEQFDLVPAGTGQNAVALGAALLAVERLLSAPLASSRDDLRGAAGTPGKNPALQAKSPGIPGL
ncbi:ROK family transcriptional regulator [Subtercola frigoramans]|uniref:NBD/HSP70 family sugar kinase n=1 Tax=Subtercola frigoramans TaxID=120298 RepID=A0ABS2L7Y2_9MICO|nr:ROK family transcriptional regulator [Subtercola frigoramans]MBM7473208.1 putative NBD/HSP70 family sugar kinase [Subtercola frigoramans]